MNIPEGLKYTKEHEWVKEENGFCLVGITDFAQGELGDIIYLDITSEPGVEVKQGEVIGSIEAIKTVSEGFSPVSGKIVEINSGINDNPSMVNTDPYGAGWMLKIEPSSAGEFSSLMDSVSYKSLVGA
ncbi:MAG: glycine cleavage system protein GcvH [Ignavibacteria bacterium]|nr:glycine cleavage system protein GcvH [Ignavibacteria bacterium]